MWEFMLIVIMFMLMFLCAWICARATVFYYILRTPHAHALISRMIQDTVNQTIMGVVMWWLFPLVGSMVLMFLIMRLYFLIRVDWLQVYDEFDEIKHKLRDIQG